MKIRITKTIGFNEVDNRHQVCLKHLFNYLQEAAATHSHQVGNSTADLLQQGYAWVLNKVGLSIKRLPRLGEEIDIVTWHKGTRGLRSYRDYRIRLGDETLLVGTSLWLFIDVQKKKIIQPPADVSARYTFETDDATDLDLDRWRPAKTFKPQHTATITTRPSDFDPLGHANNAVYLDYLEVLLSKQSSAQKTVKKLLIQYLNELPEEVPSVVTGLSYDDGGYHFYIASDEVVHAIGRIELD